MDTLFFKDVHSLYPAQGLSDAVISFYIRLVTDNIQLIVDEYKLYHNRELLPCSRMVTVVSPLLYQGICGAVTTTDSDARFSSLYRTLCVGEQIHANAKELVAFPCNLK